MEINPGDIKLDVLLFLRCGGQNAPKNATAVRLTHLPTGIVVTVKNERSQGQNREFAMNILRARLLELKTAEKDEERAILRGEYTKAEWGSRSARDVLYIRIKWSRITALSMKRVIPNLCWMVT